MGCGFNARQSALWTVDPKDFQMRGSDEMTRWCRGYLPQDGDIVLLHDNRPYALQAVEELAAQGVFERFETTTIQQWFDRSQKRFANIPIGGSLQAASANPFMLTAEAPAQAMPQHEIWPQSLNTLTDDPHGVALVDRKRTTPTTIAGRLSSLSAGGRSGCAASRQMGEESSPTGMGCHGADHRDPSVPVRDESLLADIPEDVLVLRARTWEPDYGTKQKLVAHSQAESKGLAMCAKSMAKSVVRQFVKLALQPDPQVLWVPNGFEWAKRILS